ncbi:hypothetical protein L0Y59_04925 [Candidatus Uhrbacteria bacterium]|nr:hypothetical protein [Candidatus Uhrbacteria bacterium]
MANQTNVTTETGKRPRRPLTREIVRGLIGKQVELRVETAKAAGVPEPEKDGLRRATMFVVGAILSEGAPAKKADALMAVVLSFLIETFEARGIEKDEATAKAIRRLASVDPRAKHATA